VGEKEKRHEKERCSISFQKLSKFDLWMDPELLTF
jgi:hypothetical protein